MAYNITLYSFAKRDNSTKQPSGSGTTLSGTLKYPSSILRPVVEFSAPVSNPSGFNYAYIAEFSRYYWITDWTFDRGFWIASMNVDALATYKSEIGSSSQYVTRSSASYNLNISDSKYPTLAYSTVSNEYFSNLHNEFTNGGSFVIAITDGSTVQSAGLTYYAVRDVVMRDFLDFLYGGSWLNASDISQLLQKELVNPMQYIHSIKWYPFDIPNNTQISLGSDTIKFGFWDSGITAPVLNVNDSVIGFAETHTITAHPQASRGSYLNGSPFTRLLLDCYSFGQIPIEASYFAATNQITLGIGVDVLTGTGRLTLRAGSSGDVIFRTYGQIGVDMIQGGTKQEFLGAAANVIGGSVGLAYGNVVGYAAGVMSGISALMPQLATSGSNGTKSAYMLRPSLIISRQMLVPEDIAQIGRPCCDVKTISTIAGYIECDNPDLSIAATDSELKEILSYLSSGFFYE